MQKLFFQGKAFSRILKSKEKIEKALNIKLEIKKDALIIETKKKDPFLEYIDSKILEAVSLGFNLDIALQLQNIDYTLNKINIKNFVRESRVNVATARVIGTKGKTKKLISELSNCDIVVSDHIIAIIGKSENVEIASQALNSLIKGSKQANIYKFLERNRARLRKLAEEDIEEMIKKEQKTNKKSL